MKFWWLTECGRLGSEKQAVEALSEELWFDLGRWTLREGLLCAEGAILVDGESYGVRLAYPDQFPHVPAWVEPQDPTRWSTHQYGSGALCLELRPDNWVPSATGADVLRSAYNLLVLEKPLSEGGERAPSAHAVGEVQAYAWGSNPVLISQGCRARIVSGAATGLKALSWMASKDVWPILLHDESDRCQPSHPPGTDVQTWRFEVPVFVAPSAPHSLSLDRAAFIESCGFDPETAASLATANAVVVSNAPAAMAVFHLMGEGDPHLRRIFDLPDDSGARSSRSSAAQAKRVVIVGAGSVGSKVAESLLRSGISRLRLVDGDILLPGNLERHVLDWSAVGFPKVEGLKRRLLSIVPGADVSVVSENLNWQRSARTHARQVGEIAECEVIVDATGDPATGLFLAAIARSNERAFVSVEVFEGGIGGLIASNLPDRDPPFAQARAAFLAWCDEQGAKPPEPGPRRYEALVDARGPIVADDAAVTMSAAHAARVVLDILDNRPAPPDSAWLLLGYAAAWLFEGHGHTIRLYTGEPGPEPAAAEDEAAMAFAHQLLKDALGEGSSGA